MYVMPFAEFKKLNVKQIEEMLPIEMTANGLPFAMISKKEDVIVISDMHIRARKQLRAREALIRRGMPAPKAVYKEDVVAKEEITKEV